MTVTTFNKKTKVKTYYVQKCEALDKFLSIWDNKPSDDNFLRFAKHNKLIFSENLNIFKSRVLSDQKSGIYESYKIEKDIPLQKQIRFTKYPFREMEVGDSFIISDNYSRYEMTLKSNAARNWANMSGLDYKFALRRTEDGKIRIWRTK